MDSEYEGEQGHRRVLHLSKTIVTQWTVLESGRYDWGLEGLRWQIGGLPPAPRPRWEVRGVEMGKDSVLAGEYRYPTVLS